MAKRQPSLLEALQLLGLGQEQPAPKQETPPKPKPKDEYYNPRGRGPSAGDTISQNPVAGPNIPGPSFKGSPGSPADFVNKEIPSAIDELGAVPGGLAELLFGGGGKPAQQGGVMPPLELLERPAAYGISAPKPQEGPVDPGSKYLKPGGPRSVEEIIREIQSQDEFQRSQLPYTDKSRELLGMPAQQASMGGVREPAPEARYQPAESDSRGRTVEPVDLGAIIQRGTNEPPVEAVKQIGGPSNIEGVELQMLAKKATEYQKPGLLDAIAVLANSINPRQTPQASMQFAQLLRGEPERQSAERSLARLTEARGRRQSEEVRQGGQYALEGLRQGGATDRAKIGAGARLGAAQIGQQGLIQRTGMQGDTARDVANIRANAPGQVTPGQRIQAANFHALGGIQAELGNVRKAIEAANMSLDPAAKANLPALEQRRSQLDALKREAIGLLHSAGAFSDEEAAMFALGEGQEMEGMDPEFTEALRMYRDQLNKLLPR